LDEDQIVGADYPDLKPVERQKKLDEAGSPTFCKAGEEVT